MNEKQFEEELKTVLDDRLHSLPSGVKVDAIRAFAETGFINGQLGLVVYLADGSEFHLVIVKSP